MKNIEIRHQKTKIIATIGPASSDYDTLVGMYKNGADIVRLNFSHGSHEDHLKVINHVTAINQEFDATIGILADLQGPKIRVGEIENGGFDFEKDEILCFSNTKCIGTKEKVYLSYQGFSNDVSVGEKVLVDDGKIHLEVVEKKDNDVYLKALVSGNLKSKKGVNLPDTNVSLPSLTEKDRKDLDFVLTQPVNWIALSFVRKMEDIQELKQIVSDRGHYAKVIAKIEKPEALTEIKGIIKVSDAIMIARGDLGVEVPMERLPGIQKDIISRCIQKSKPVIVATQMMESMITSPTPTRAEITDVANAVLDGSDAVMLSGETSVGAYPTEVVKSMSKIIEQAEKHYAIQGKRPKTNTKSETFFSDTICFNAAKIGEEIKAKAILGITVSGHTAFKVSSYRPPSNIYIFSSVKQMLGTLNLLWGVRGFYYDKFTSTDETIEDLVGILKDKNLLKEGDVVVNTMSMPLHKRFITNTLKITTIE